MLETAPPATEPYNFVRIAARKMTSVFGLENRLMAAEGVESDDQ